MLAKFYLYGGTEIPWTLDLPIIIGALAAVLVIAIRWFRSDR